MPKVALYARYSTDNQSVVSIEDQFRLTWSDRDRSNVTPHVTQDNAVTKTGKSRTSAIDERTTRHPGYGMLQSRRAMTECIFGWGKQHGTMRKIRHRGIMRVAADFMLNLIAYNLIRILKLMAA